ncbi:MAG TPA: alpha/beta fold hydrolase, partial [Gemmatimonadales bacterium]|nr:alpha/beta fold hydrolase [Gemmatimonadales bacterium]
ASNVAAIGRFAGTPLRHRRHLLCVDARGTGSSAPLDCAFRFEQPMGFLRAFLPLPQIRACRDSLARHADLTQYVTPNVVDDLDDVRQALGIPQVTLWGSSGGTRQALVWMRRHPASVRAAMLEGPVPMDARVPLTFAADAQDALDGVLGECLAAPDCAHAFPNVKADFQSVMGRLAAEAVTVRVTHPPGGAEHEITLTGSAFAQVIRYMLYTPAGAAALPLAVSRAAAGDYREIARRAVISNVPGGIALGFYLSNTCAEDVGFVDDAEAERRARGTFLGLYRVRQQQDACAEWPRALLPPDYLQPVRSDTPVLILVGERDPVTPARWGHEISAHLRHSVVIVVPDGAHSFAGLEHGECLNQLRAAFLDAASPAINTDCLAQVRREPFQPPGDHAR